MQGKVSLFFIDLAMFKMAFFCQTSRFRDLLASGPLFFLHVFSSEVSFNKKVAEEQEITEVDQGTQDGT